jgi:hypothetical protein
MRNSQKETTMSEVLVGDYDWMLVHDYMHYEDMAFSPYTILISLGDSMI